MSDIKDNKTSSANIESSGSFYSLFNLQKYKKYFGNINIGINIKEKIEAVGIYFENVFKKYENEFIVNDEDIKFLDFCNISYTLPENRPINCKSYTLLSEKIFNNQVFVTYINHESKEIIISYKGTDIKNIHDIISDLETILGVNAIDQRLFSALEAYDTLKSEYSNYKMYLCGHSLGGTMSYLIMKHRNADRCTVFNPGSVPNKLFLDMAEDTLSRNERVKNIYTYRVLGDPISIFSYVGNTKIFRVSDVDPLRLHSLQIFFDNTKKFIK